MKKIISTLAGFCFLFSDVAGQEIEWQNTIGGSWEDKLYSIQQTSDNGYILGGTSISSISGDKTENSLGGDDYWIIKLDSIGNIQWQNTIGGFTVDELHSISQTMDGGYICGGYSVSGISGDKTESNLGGYDYWVVKLDPLGNIQWQNTIGGSNNDYLNSISQSPDGGYICGGYSSSNISGDKTENTLGPYDYWIVKLDSVGSIEWQNTVGGNSQEWLYSIVATSDGGCAGIGWSDSDSSGDKTEGNMSLDYWIVRLDAFGNLQWENTLGGNDYDEPYSVIQTNDGGFICGGRSASDLSGDKSEGNMGSNNTYDYWIIKLDTAGDIQWQNTIGGNDNDFLYSITQATNGDYICGGWSSSHVSGDKTENSNGSDDYWVVKLDVFGNVQSQNSVGGAGLDFFTCLHNTNDYGYVLGGYSSSNISCDKTENNIGGFWGDYWVVKITDKYNSIIGKLFFDANSNGLQDAGEQPLVYKSLTETNNLRFAFSDQNGNYRLSVLDSGNFSVSPASINYYNAVPATHAVNFSGFHQTDSLNDFAFQPAGVFNDLCITITPMGNFRANINASYMINYENVGTTTLNGTVILFPDNDVTFVSSNVAPTSVTPDSVVWNAGTLTPFQTGSILVTVHVNAGTPVGTLINSSVVIEPVAGDANTACNYNSWEVFVTGAVDPNAILVDRDTVLTTELSSPPYLNYIIYFQNTGNDTAFNARVLNNIPQMLDVNSFEFVASSHPVNINYGAHSRLFTFTFDNINLPDSGANEPGSHGFICYRIKPLSTLVAGDSIKNNAAIYFDFNQPVMTDTAVTEIVLPTGVSSQWSVVSGQLKVFPNPAGEELIVKSDLLTG
ncbi:MAG TPA: hypothetical protein VJY62_18755, partial [Bacteroidia bacterium]|nr:hypothetical protein [Bacteroidia bacterium]